MPTLWLNSYGNIGIIVYFCTNLLTKSFLLIMNSIKINDPRTQVTEVYISEVKLASGTEYEVLFKVRSHSGGNSHFSTRVKPGTLTLKSEDTIGFVDQVGNNRTAVITPTGVFMSGTGFTKSASPQEPTAKTRANTSAKAEKKKKQKAAAGKSLFKKAWDAVWDDDKEAWAQAYKLHQWETEMFSKIMEVNLSSADEDSLIEVLANCEEVLDLDDKDAFGSDYSTYYSDYLSDQWDKTIDKKEDRFTEKLDDDFDREDERRLEKIEREEEDDKQKVKAGTLTKDEMKQRKKDRKKEYDKWVKGQEKKQEKSVEELYDEEPDWDEVAEKEDKRINDDLKKSKHNYVRL